MLIPMLLLVSEIINTVVLVTKNSLLKNIKDIITSKVQDTGLIMAIDLPPAACLSSVSRNSLPKSLNLLKPKP